MIVFRWEQAIVDYVSVLPRSGPVFDVMHFISHPGLRGSLLCAVALIVICRSRLKSLTTPVLLGGVAAGIGDLVSNRLVKSLHLRMRPHCLNEICSGSYAWGFVSSHATNITAFSIIFVLTDRRNIFWVVPLILLVSATRIYLIDHYPLDVVGGIALGSAIGISVFGIFNKIKRSQK